MPTKPANEEPEQRVKELEKKEEYLSALLENTKEGILISDANGIPQIFNSAYARAMKEILGLEMKPGIQPHKSLDDPEQVRFWDDLHKHVLGGEKFNAEFSYKLNDGDVRHFEISFVPIEKDGDVSGFTEITRDITDRKMAEEALRTSEAKFRMIAENATDVIWLLDIETMQETYISPSVKGLTGFSVEEHLKRKLEDIITPEHIHLWTDRILEEIERISELPGDQYVSDRFEWEEYHKDGTKYWVEGDMTLLRDKQGKPTHILGVNRDITDRIKSQEALKKSEDKFRSLFENTGTATLVAEEDMTISQINSNFVELSGYSEDEIVGKMKASDFVAPEDMDRVVGYHCNRVKAVGKPPSEYEFSFIDKNGDIKPALIKVGIIPEKKQSIISVIDLTKQKAVENKLRESEERFRHLAEMLPEPIYEMDSTGKLTFANEAAFETFMYRRVSR